MLFVLADVSGAIKGIADLLIGYLPECLTVVLVIAGYIYMFSLDDHNKASQAKRAIGVAIAGAILVALAASLGPKIITAIGK